MADKLTYFLTRHHACSEGLSRLATTGAKTLEEAFERADALDLIWAVTRLGVMSEEQRRRFLAEAVLAPVEDLLTDERSKNILQKLRTNEQITQEDKAAAVAAADAAARAARSAAYAADAADATSWAAYAASRAADAAAWAAASRAADADAAAWDAQAKWIRENFALSDLNIN